LRTFVCYPTRVKRTFLIDTDTASDDAVALIMALRARDIRVAAWPHLVETWLHTIHMVSAP